MQALLEELHASPVPEDRVPEAFLHILHLYRQPTGAGDAANGVQQPGSLPTTAQWKWEVLRAPA